MMRNVVTTWLVLVLVAVSVPIKADAQDTKKQSMSKLELEYLYTEFLKDEGYRPEIRPDGMIHFKREGRTYVINVSETEKDPQFFRVILPNIWKIDSEKTRSQVFIAADFSNARAKVTKVFTVKEMSGRV
jgi:hypothetical protein